MDACTEATTGAVTVVVAGVVVLFVHVFVGKRDLFLIVVEALWVEDLGVTVVIFVVVEAPDIEDESCAFGEEATVDPFIYSSSVWFT